MMLDSNIQKGLVVIPRMPYPLNSGGRIAIFDAIKILASRYKLILVIIDDTPSNKQYVKELECFSNEIYFFSKKKYRFWINSLLGLAKGDPLQMGYFYFPEVQQLVNSLVSSCDFFYAFMIRTTKYGCDLRVKKGHYAIDSMYLNYKKSQENSTSILWKLIYRIEVPLLFKAEKHQIQTYDLTTFVNKDEAAFWDEYGNVATLPHGVESDILMYDKSDNKYGKIVSFIGRMDYQPNIDAVLWFCNNVVQRLHKDIQFWILGGFPTDAIKNLEKLYDNVKVKGFVDDPYVILRSSICTVAPMQTGGGLQTKILMAMAVESLVLSSSLCVKAIEGAIHNRNILVEDDPKAMADLINDIYIFPHKYMQIKTESKLLILENYSLDIIERKLLNLVGKYLS